MGFVLEPRLPTLPLLLVLETGVPTDVAGMGLSLLPNFAPLPLDWACEKPGKAVKAITPIAALNQFRTINSSLYDVKPGMPKQGPRSEEHTSELQSLRHLVCRL